MAAGRDALGERHVFLQNFVLFRRGHLAKVIFISVNKQQILHFDQASSTCTTVNRTKNGFSTILEKFIFSEA